MNLTRYVFLCDQIYFINEDNVVRWADLEHTTAEYGSVMSALEFDLVYVQMDRGTSIWATSVQEARDLHKLLEG